VIMGVLGLCWLGYSAAQMTHFVLSGAEPDEPLCGPDRSGKC
jgi:hypothetical protein